jgi:hypothetical protein
MVEVMMMIRRSDMVWRSVLYAVLAGGVTFAIAALVLYLVQGDFDHLEYAGGALLGVAAVQVWRAVTGEGR